MTTTPTSGAADLPEALHRSTAADGKTELFNLPGYPLMVRAVDFNRIHAESEMRRAALLDEMQKAALAAGQATAAQAVVPAGWKLVPVDATDEMVRATDKVNFENGDTDGTLHNVWHAMIAAAPAQPAAQQGVAFAALPTSSHAGRVYEEGFLIGTCPLYTAEKMRDFADRTHAIRASHGQASSQAAGSIYRNSVSGEFELDYAGEDHQKGVHVDFYIDPPTHSHQAADSVQEDAARYRFLRDGEWRDTDLEPFIRLQLNTLWDAKIDAARKQGASHDR